MALILAILIILIWVGLWISSIVFIIEYSLDKDWPFSLAIAAFVISTTIFLSPLAFMNVDTNKTSIYIENGKCYRHETYMIGKAVMEKSIQVNCPTDVTTINVTPEKGE